MTRLLIIDDETEMLNGLHKIFMQKGGFQVELVEQAEQAIKIIQQQTFDIILCDLFLKEASGMDVLKASRTYAPGVRSEPSITSPEKLPRVSAAPHPSHPGSCNECVSADGTR